MKDSVVPVTVDEDAFNECDTLTLGLRGDDQPRRGGAGVNDMTSVDISTLTTPSVQTPSQLPNATLQLSSREDTGIVTKTTGEKIDETSARRHEIKSKENTASNEQANNISGPLTSRMAISSSHLPHTIEFVTAGTTDSNDDDNADSTDTLGLRYGDEHGRGERGMDSESMVLAITAPTIQTRPRSRQTTKPGGIESPGKSPQPTTSITASDVNPHQRLMPPKPTRQISDTIQNVINEHDTEEDAHTPGLHYDDAPRRMEGKRDYQPMTPPTSSRHTSDTCVTNQDDNEDDTDTQRNCSEDESQTMGRRGGAESVGEPLRPGLGPGAHHIYPSYAATQDIQQLGSISRDDMVHITEATLVEEEERRQREVIMGTRIQPLEPALSWWKHKHARLTLACLCAALVVMSIALWFAFPSGVEEISAVQPRSPRTPHSSPPSKASSFSPYPSLSPSSNPSMAYIEGLFETDCDSCDFHVAVDGDTAVVAREFDIHFFTITHSSFEIVAKIDINYTPTAATIDNNTVAIGSYYEVAVYVYERDQNGTWSQAMLIQPTDLCWGSEFVCGGGAWFGRAIAIDHNIMVVGAPRDGGKGQGSAFVYRRNENTWTQEAKLTSSANYFGVSVSVTGTSIAVGDPGQWVGCAIKGAVFVYRFDSLASSWNSVGGVSLNYVCDKYTYFVRLLDDKDLLVVCRDNLSGFNTGIPTVYHYEKPGVGDEYVLKQGIKFDHPVDSIAVDQNSMVVSEFRVGRSFGIHVFVQNINGWEEIAIVDESIFGARFGKAIALSGNMTLIASDRNLYQMALF